jgi:hypothetical protein
MSVFSAIISRGSDVQFARNAAIEVRFGSQPVQGNHLLEAAGN